MRSSHPLVEVLEVEDVGTFCGSLIISARSGAKGLFAPLRRSCDKRLLLVKVLLLLGQQAGWFSAPFALLPFN